MRAFVQRRELLLGLAALPAAARIAVAETYPLRPVRILVATSAGGGTDLVARFIAIGTEMAARSPADGYTLFMANTVNTINNSLYQKLNYNFIADFAPVANVMGTPLLVLVHPSVAAKNAAELIALAKASPGKLNLASGGVGSTGHMSAELFQMMADIKFTHVPYRGEAPALTDLIGGQAELMVSTTARRCSTPGPAQCARSRRRPTTVWPNCPMCRRCRRRCRAIGPTPEAASARRKARLWRSSPCSTRR